MSIPMRVPERGFRTPGCGPACRVIRAVIAGAFGRSELLLCDPETHEEYGRFQASGVATNVTIVTGRLAVDLASLDVSVDGEPIRLAAIELRILVHLARRVGVLCSHDEILTSAWGADLGRLGRKNDDRHPLRTSMARLRGKLGPVAGLITTVSDIGYRLDAVAPGNAARPWPRFGRWSKLWDACRNCGGTDKPVRARGYCQQPACSRLARASRPTDAP